MSGQTLRLIGHAWKEVTAFQSEPMTALELTRHVLLVLTGFAVAYLVLAFLDVLRTRQYTKSAPGQKRRSGEKDEVEGILITIEERVRE